MMPQQHGGRRLAFVALFAAGASWGLGFPLGKLAMRELAPPHMILLRFAVASIAALPFAIGPDARRMFRSPAVLVSGLFYGLAFVVQFEGLARVSVTLAALLVGAMPALIAVAARLLGEPVSRASWAGVIAATLGAALIAGKPGGAGSVAGVVLSLVSLLLFLVWLLSAKRAPSVASAMALPAVTIVVGTLAVLPVALAMQGMPDLRLSAPAWVGIVGQGLISTLFATAAWQYGAARIDSASAGVFINLEPLIGAILGVALFGDRLTAALVAGGLLILGGSIAVVRGERPAPPAALTGGSPPSPA